MDRFDRTMSAAAVGIFSVLGAGMACLITFPWTSPLPLVVIFSIGIIACIALHNIGQRA